MLANELIAKFAYKCLLSRYKWLFKTNNIVLLCQNIYKLKYNVNMKVRDYFILQCRTICSLLIYSLCGILIILQISCSDKDEFMSKDAAVELQMSCGEEFAKQLATSLKSKELYSYICSKAAEEFDGDENFLIIPNWDSPELTKEGNLKTFKQLLKESRVQYSQQMNLEYLFTRMKEKSPLQQIYVMNSHLLSSYTKIPLVVYLPDDFDQNKTTHVNAYDVDGNYFKLDPKGEYEDQVMFVVSQNERTVIVNKNEYPKSFGMDELNHIYSNELYDYYIVKDYSQSHDTSSKTSKEVHAKICDRDRSSIDKDYIHSIRINGKDAWQGIEAAFKGDPELYIYAYYGEKLFQNNYATKDIRKGIISGDYGRRRKIKTVYPNIDIKRWNREENGDHMKYVWNEADGSIDGGIASFEFELNVFGKPVITGSGVLHLLDNDDPAGESFVYYTENSGTHYNTGTLTFSIQER